MIGGTDVVIPTRGGDAALDACVRVIRRYWPQAVFEDALTGNRVDRYELLPVGRLTEVLVYRSAGIARDWDEKGSDPALANTMIHLLLANSGISVVVDDAVDAGMHAMLASIKSVLRMDILNLTARERDAA